MAKYSLDEIENLPADYFLPELSSKRTGIHFFIGFDDNVIELRYITEWKPIGKTEERGICGNKSYAVLFENNIGERTWMHVW